MSELSFSHSLFWHHPISSLCFFALAMSFISLWVRKTIWLWGSFFLIAYILAFETKIVTWISLIPVLILFLCHYYLKNDLSKKTRFLLFCAAIAVSLGLAFHFLPGFYNWKLIDNLCLSPGAHPYSLWLNFDKPLIGIFALAYGIPLICSKTQLVKAIKSGIPMTLLGIFILMGLSLYFHLVEWNPKIPLITLVWLFENLLFVSVPEEAFFRGFIQRELYRWFGETPIAGFGSICITSVIFTLLHLVWVAHLPFLILVLIASVIYGTIYHVTRSIEASIFCHFALNTTHFLFFTYPALQN